jgi:hypothetical protein
MSLLLAQQEQHIQMLIGTIMTMFNIEMIEELNGGDNKRTGNYVNFKQWRINVDLIVAHIEDQRLFPQQCYEELDAVNQELVVKDIGMFVMELVISLQDIKAKRDDANRPLDLDAPLVLLTQLAKFRTSMFIWEVLDLFHAHISKFWLVEKIDLIDDEHCDLLEVYNSDPILEAAIDKQNHQITFNPGWDVLPTSRFDSLRAFVGGLATMFTNTTLVESNFFIIKWEMDEN